jgi:8-oxo-dGTP diphosphatase
MNQLRFCSACGAAAVERQIDGYLRNVCTGCSKVLYRNPAPAAGCLIERDGAVVLVRRKFEPYMGCWHIPSGFVEYGEDVEDAARREVLEETGLVVDLGPVFRVYSYFDDPRQHGIIILYRAVVVGGVLEAGDDAAEAAFFPWNAPPPEEQIGFATHRRALQEWRNEMMQSQAPPLGMPHR